MKKRITYIVSDINKALAFEWIVKYLPQEQTELDFILLNPGESVLEHFLKDNGIPVKTIRCRGKRDWPGAFRELFGYLRKRKPDIVHCHLQQACVLGLSAARLAGVPARIYTRHHSDYHHRFYPKGVYLDRYCNAVATRIVAPSLVVKEILCRYEHVPEEKISLVPHGFDLEYFRNVSPERILRLKEKYSIGPEYPVIGVISRFTALKGLQYIIPAFKRILNTHPGAVLMLFNATGDYADRIHALLGGLPSENIRIIPFEQDLGAVYGMFDIFIQASIERTIEAFGQTYVEALAAGVPSIFTLAGIAGDFVEDGKQALVVPFRDEDAVFDAVIRLTDDKSLREKLKAEGMKAVSARFGIDRMISGLQNIYFQ